MNINMTNNMKVYPNTKRYRIYSEFGKGKHPSELVDEYGLKYNTLMQYYHSWKHRKGNNNPMIDLIKHIHKSKPVKTIPNKVKPVENPKKVEEIVMIPKDENTRIPNDITIPETTDFEWKPVEKRERFNPFG